MDRQLAFLAIVVCATRVTWAGVEISSFTATVHAPDSVVVEWTTLTETNNHGFVVQKSQTTPTNFQPIPNSFVPGNGTTLVPHSYSFTDRSIPAGTWHYRLQQIDLSGPVHYTFSIPVVVPLTPPASVSLVSPLQGAVVSAPQAMLVWRTGTPAVDRYQVEQAADSLFTTPVVDSTLVDTMFVVTGLQHEQRVWWRVRARNTMGWGPYSPARSFTAIHTVQVPLAQGWNMVALPVATTADSVRQVFPECLTPYAFGFDHAVGYVQRYRLEPGVGYWAKFPGATIGAVAGYPVLQDSIPVEQGWNIIGSLSVPVDTADVETLPPGILNSVFYTFDGGTIPVSVLNPGRAHWIKTSTSGVIILRPSP